MATGSGIDAQLALGEESTYGTAVTPDRFYEFNSESLTMDPTFLEPTSIRSGVKFKRISQIKRTRRTITGDVVIPLATRNMGLIAKHMLGSSATATQINSTDAYEQYHHPGGFLDRALTAQVGRPDVNQGGTVVPFDYMGLKVVSWEFSLTDGEVPTLTLTMDGQDVSTESTLVQATYKSNLSVFDFANTELKIGGTASTSGGQTTISGASAVATVVNEITLSGETSLNVERFGVGNQGLKNQPVENGVSTVTGELSAEFNKTELYDVFAQNETTALTLTMTGGTVGTSSEVETFEFMLPAVKLKTTSPVVEGMDVVSMSTEVESYKDDVGSNPPVQVKIISADTEV